MTFSYNLSWSPHIEKAVKKASSICNRIRFIRQSLSQEQTLKVLTSYYYSSIYYGSAVWLGPMTTSNDWKLLNKAHYRALRVVTRDFRREKSKRVLDEECKRATPRQWGHYVVASTAASIMQNQEPSLLFELITGNSTWNDRKPGRRDFYDTSRLRVGRQSLQNRLREPFRMMRGDWYGTGLTKDAIRVRMKESFFPYYTRTATMDH